MKKNLWLIICFFALRGNAQTKEEILNCVLNICMDTTCQYNCMYDNCNLDGMRINEWMGLKEDQYKLSYFSEIYAYPLRQQLKTLMPPEAMYCLIREFAKDTVRESWNGSLLNHIKLVNAAYCDTFLSWNLMFCHDPRYPEKRRDRRKLERDERWQTDDYMARVALRSEEDKIVYFVTRPYFDESGEYMMMGIFSRQFGEGSRGGFYFFKKNNGKPELIAQITQENRGYIIR